MKKYAKIINEQTKQCEVGLGTNSNFYQSIGMSEMEVEQAYNGLWYAKGYAPQKPQEAKEQEVRAIRDKMIDDFEWRISRNNDERELGIEETDERQSLLEYRAYLRDYTKEENWHEGNPLTFDSWLAKQKDMLQEGE